MSLLTPCLRHYSPAGADARLSILIFHRVLSAPDALFPYEPDARWFDALARRLARWFNVLPLDEAVEMRSQGRLPERAAAITFDDGYYDNFSVAMPILRRNGLCATFFISTGFLDGGRMWNDSVVESVRQSADDSLDLTAFGIGHVPVADVHEKRQAIDRILAGIKYLPVAERASLAEEIAKSTKAKLPDNLMMTSAQVLAMHRAGMQIGAHTVSHPILARLDDASARAEIATSKSVLEGIVGRRIGLFAYPNGKLGDDYLPRDIDIVRQLGFDSAVSTNIGASRPTDDKFQLPRFTPWDRGFLRFGARMVRNLAQS